MKRALLSIFALLFIANNLFGQLSEPTITWGEWGEQTIKTTASNYEIIGTIGNKTYVSRFKGFSYSYLAFNKDMMISREEICEGDFISFKKTRESVGFYASNNQLLHVIMENHFDEDGTTVTVLKSIDGETLKATKTTTVLTRYPIKKYQWSFLKTQSAISADGNLVALLANNRFDKSTMENNATNDFHILVYNANHEKVRDFTWKYPTELNRIDIKSFNVDNDGNVMIWFQVFAKGSRPQSIMAVYPVEGEPKWMTFDDERKTFVTMKIDFSPEGKLNLSGFYTDPLDKERVRGVYYITYDMHQNAITTKIHTPATNATFDLFKGGGGQSLIPKIRHVATIVKPEGGYVFLGELVIPNLNATTSTSTENMFGVCGNIIAINIDATGKLLGETTIHKKQNGPTKSLEAHEKGLTGGSILDNLHFSFIFGYENNKLKVIYNDDKKNVNEYNPALMKVCYANADAVIMYGEMDLLNGSYKKVPLFQYSDEDSRLILKPPFCQMLANNVWIAFAYHELDGSLNKNIIGKLTFE